MTGSTLEKLMHLQTGFQPTTTNPNALPRLRAPTNLTRTDFGVRFRASYVDAAFRSQDRAITRLEEIAWHDYCAGR